MRCLFSRNLSAILSVAPCDSSVNPPLQASIGLSSKGELFDDIFCRPSPLDEALTAEPGQRTPDQASAHCTSVSSNSLILLFPLTSILYIVGWGICWRDSRCSTRRAEDAQLYFSCVLLIMLFTQNSGDLVRHPGRTFSSLAVACYPSMVTLSIDRNVSHFAARIGAYSRGSEGIAAASSYVSLLGIVAIIMRYGNAYLFKPCSCCRGSLCARLCCAAIKPFQPGLKVLAARRR